VTIDRQTLRHRTICESILRVVNLIWRANPGIAATVGKLREGLSTSAVPPAQDEITTALAELCLRGLIEPKPIRIAGYVDETGYVPTSRGLDFQDHSFPWDLVDSFAKRHDGGGS
jgi:hypothetical protein